MKKILIFLVSIFPTVSAFAQPLSLSNFYIDGFVGVNFVNSFNNDDVWIDLNCGYAVGGALGYRFSRFFRLEGEAAYRCNTFDQLVANGLRFPASGSIQNVAAMANGLIEIPLFENTLIPYFGGGIGKSWNRNNFQLEPIITNERIYVFDRFVESSCGITGQGIVGLVFSTGQKMHASVEYRYLDGSHIQGNHTIDLNLKRYF